MRSHWFILIAILLTWTLAGCAFFTPTPRLAHIQIIGPGNYTKDFVLSLEDLENKKPAGIKLTDRYAIEIDLQWLWYGFEDLNSNYRTNNADGTKAPLTPWFICKYRF